MPRETASVAVITGTRAEFGLLRPVIRRIMADSELSLRLVVTGSHLCPALGNTIDEIRAAGMPVSREIDILLGDPATPPDVALTRAIAEFSRYFQVCRPDMALVLGDRYEIFGAVTAAAMRDIPVAHISGGETTEGAKDEFFRHCITKMSCLHFAAAEPYRRRIIQLGEQPAFVFNAGALGAENILTLQPLPRETLAAEIGFDLSPPFLLCTYHPETLGDADPVDGLNELLAAIDGLGLRCLFTAANADAGGDAVNARLAGYCAANPQSKLVKSLGVLRYLSAMRYCAAVCGNSSSAIVEAPTLRRPAVNVGDRQKGRVMADSILCCGSDRASIRAALERAVSPVFQAAVQAMDSPFGGTDASRIILREIKTALLCGISLKKAFYDLDFAISQDERQER